MRCSGSAGGGHSPAASRRINYHETLRQWPPTPREPIKGRRAKWPAATVAPAVEPIAGCASISWPTSGPDSDSAASKGLQLSIHAPAGERLKPHNNCLGPLIVCSLHIDLKPLQ